ncbi:CDP-diacylglycerol--glycerol-3-phosphate 3-phosphatidyltransferase [Brevibacterium linens]|uniref:CDP-diacylglycerol--glycerol-3-phosphate 3-phosphatidyltransferase n=1 Tax=Brevibacterium linens TaxID=1703 RepID=UPI000FCABD50|nr:CDP-diacylglycerol--glycerol-3-phosphate 3-phosphatidyltransferase [Brevibacterium linens]AZU01211.1 CDP-diacylglycerol--glycerol-3-phosphate 3-phosphatidyltransferase [Brevibacterium linens]
MNDRIEAGASQQPAAEPSPWNIPNALTVLRIIMVPLFLVLLLTDGGNDVTLRWWALVVFLLAMFTDFVDGYLARRNNLITNFGKIADPIADKSLMAAALIGLAIIAELPWWVPVIILVREFGITVLRFFMIRIAVMPASRGGKIKTVLQTAAIGLFLVVFPLSDVAPSVVSDILLVVAWVIMAAAIVVTIVTGVDYCVQAAKLYKDAKNGKNAPSGGDGPSAGDTQTGGDTQRG